MSKLIMFNIYNSDEAIAVVIQQVMDGVMKNIGSVKVRQASGASQSLNERLSAKSSTTTPFTLKSSDEEREHIEDSEDSKLIRKLK